MDAMTAEREPIEYPDEAGYPDGTGFLDEGTAATDAADAPDAGADQDAAPSVDGIAAFADTDEEDAEPADGPDV
ncbi:hypothetical protein ASE16_11525 [Leifsonia sp. Root227]|nr:hypothetical protein ASE16_11525 [Leifsonia sp. Root227]